MHLYTHLIFNTCMNEWGKRPLSFFLFIYNGCKMKSFTGKRPSRA